MATDLTIRCDAGNVLQVGARVKPVRAMGVTIVPGGVVVLLSDDDGRARVRVGYDDGLHDSYPAIQMRPDGDFICGDIETEDTLA